MVEALFVYLNIVIEVGNCDLYKLVEQCPGAFGLYGLYHLLLGNHNVFFALANVLQCAQLIPQGYDHPQKLIYANH